MTIEEGRTLPIGVSIIDEKVNFSVSVARDKACSLLLYKKGEDIPVREIPMPHGVGDIRCIRLVEVPKDYEYNYLVEGRLFVDPYVKSLVGRENWNQKIEPASHQVKGRVYTKNFDWKGDKSPGITHDLTVAYSLHVRGFTKHDSSKVRHKGTFEGILEKLPYIKSLGINQLQCMPIYDFIEQSNPINYWGYGEGYFFAPKGAYAAKKDATLSLKELVLGLHKSGIELVLEMPFTKDISEDMVLSCLRHYVCEYHIDGFILNPSWVQLHQLKKDPVLAGVKLFTHDTRVQNILRRFLKGDEGMVADVMREIVSTDEKNEHFCCITSHTGFTLKDLVSYDGKHNEENGENNTDGPELNYSWNCGMEGPTRKKSVTKLRHIQIRNAFFLLLLSKGTPCILAGDEFENSQNGNNNAYCQDNLVSWLDWRLVEHNKEQVQFVRDLIAFRKKHQILSSGQIPRRSPYERDRIPQISFHGTSLWKAPIEIASRILGVCYSEKESLYLAFNMHWMSHEFALPREKNKNWYLVADTKEGIRKEPLLLKNQERVELEERSIKVIIGI